MSRTYKDRPTRIRFPQYTIDDKYEYFEYELETPRLNWHGKLITHSKYSLKKAGYLPKKSRREDTVWRWQSTPSWWTRMYMTRPERTRAKREVAKIKYCADLEEVDIPNLKKKPHVYYW